jgi:Tfp pilus assembly protein PilO
MTLFSGLSRVDVAGAGVILTLSAVAYFGVLGPATAQRQAIASQRSMLAERATELSTLESQVRTTQGRLGELERATQVHQVSLLPPSAINGRLSELTALADESGLKLDTIAPEAATRGRRFGRTPIRLGGEGSYPQFAAFARRLHERFSDTAIEGFSLEGNPAVPGAPARFSVRLFWYTLPADADAARTDRVGGEAPAAAG